jgi:hypothetical protein
LTLPKTRSPLLWGEPYLWRVENNRLEVFLMQFLRFRFALLQLAGAMLLAIVTFSLPQVAQAGASADYTRQALEKGQWDEAEKELSNRINANAGDDEARFGLALVRFVHAIEKFGHHQYQYGLKPDAEKFGLPFLHGPFPPNPKPELLTYEIQRKALQTLLEDLTEVDKTLAAMQGKDVKIAIDLEKIHLDFAPGSQGDTPVTLMNVLRSYSQPVGRQPSAEVFEVSFDQSDAIWLRGYTHLLSAGLEFVLAYDWHETFATTAGLFYPRLRVEGEYSALGLSTDRKFEYDIADLIALVHEIRWPAVEPARLKAVREHLKQVTALSRQNWKSILAETDDDHEWLPSPKQKNGVMPALAPSQERVDTWLSALDDFDAVLDGRILIPYWRTEKGINLRRVFEEPRSFDLVLWATGHAAVPYLETGPLLTREKWAVWERVFQGDFLTFAAYVN